MDTPQKRRAGIPKTLTLDRDAVALIPFLVESHKGVGRLMSELIRSEVIRREERARRVAEGQVPWAVE